MTAGADPPISTRRKVALGVSLALGAATAGAGVFALPSGSPLWLGFDLVAVALTLAIALASLRAKAPPWALPLVLALVPLLVGLERAARVRLWGSLLSRREIVRASLSEELSAVLGPLRTAIEHSLLLMAWVSAAGVIASWQHPRARGWRWLWPVLAAGLFAALLGGRRLGPDPGLPYDLTTPAVIALAAVAVGSALGGRTSPGPDPFALLSGLLAVCLLDVRAIAAAFERFAHAQLFVTGRDSFEALLVASDFSSWRLGWIAGTLGAGVLLAGWLARGNRGDPGRRWRWPSIAATALMLVALGSGAARLWSKVTTWGARQASEDRIRKHRLELPRSVKGGCAGWPNHREMARHGPYALIPFEARPSFEAEGRPLEALTRDALERWKREHLPEGVEFGHLHFAADARVPFSEFAEAVRPFADVPSTLLLAERSSRLGDWTWVKPGVDSEGIIVVPQVHKVEGGGEPDAIGVLVEGSHARAGLLHTDGKGGYSLLGSLGEPFALEPRFGQAAWTERVASTNQSIRRLLLAPGPEWTLREVVAFMDLLFEPLCVAEEAELERLSRLYKERGNIGHPAGELEAPIAWLRLTPDREGLARVLGR